MADIRTARPDDLDGIFDLLSTRSRATFGISEVEREHVAEALVRANGTDRWVAADRRTIVGYAALDSSQELVHAAVDAETGDALLARAEARARERGFARLAVTTVPEDRALTSLAGATSVRARARHPAHVARRSTASRPQASWPAGVTVRTYEDEDGERVHALLDLSYAGWDTSYVAVPHDDWLAFMTGHDEFDPTLWFLVERDGELVGCALHWREHRSSGWVKDIVVAESERGRGLGRALLHHALRAYATRGAARVGLKVDSGNPTGALQLYARVGFVTDRRYGIWTRAL